MKVILAEKQEMTQRYSANGSIIPVTKVQAGPCVIAQIKTPDRDGYAAIQVGFGQRRKLSKPLKGHLKTLGSFRHLREFRAEDQDLSKLNLGDQITVTTFQPGDVVTISGASKGKGFQGVVRRWGFHGSPKTHGHKDQLRMPGSIGAGEPQHVFKGTRMGGRMGGSQVTVSNLQVVEVDPAENVMYIKGAIPGAVGNLVEIIAPGELTVMQSSAVTIPAVEAAAAETAEPMAAAEVAPAGADAESTPLVTEDEAPAAEAEPAPAANEVEQTEAKQ